MTSMNYYSAIFNSKIKFVFMNLYTSLRLNLTCNHGIANTKQVRKSNQISSNGPFNSCQKLSSLQLSEKNTHKKTRREKCVVMFAAPTVNFVPEKKIHTQTHVKVKERKKKQVRFRTRSYVCTYTFFAVKTGSSKVYIQLHRYHSVVYELHRSCMYTHSL